MSRGGGCRVPGDAAPAGSSRRAYLSPTVVRLARTSDTAIAAPRSTPTVTARRRTPTAECGWVPWLAPGPPAIPRHLRQRRAHHPGTSA